MTENVAAKKATPWKWFLRLGIGLIILALLFTRRETALEVKKSLSGVSGWVPVGAVAFYWCGQILSLVRWKLLLAARGIQLPFKACVQLYAAGMFGNLFLPTSIGGDALRAGLLTKKLPEAPLPDAAASILIERVTGFVALLMVAFAGAFFAGAFAQAGPALWAGLGFLVLFVVIVSVARKGLAKAETATGIKGKIVKIWLALDFYFTPERRGALAAAVGISLVFQISQVLLSAGLGLATGMKIPFAAYFWVHPLMQLAAMLPLGIGGLGVREAAAVQLLKGGGFNIDPGTALAWSLLWQATVWLSSLPGALALRVKSQGE